jgi:hypothetical protein
MKGSNVFWVIIITGLMAFSASGSVLSDAAAAMPSRTWATVNFNLGTGMTNITEHILVYSNSAAWDPTSGQILYQGCDHLDPWHFIIYRASTNEWRRETSSYPNHSGGYSEGTGHGYDRNTIDVANGNFWFMSHSVHYKYDISAGSWTRITPNNSNPAPTGPGAAAEFFPELNGIVYLQNRIGGETSLYNPSTNTWQSFAPPQSTGPYHVITEYNPVEKVMVMGGGNGSKELYAVDASLNIDTLALAPVNVGIHAGMLVTDPVSGNLLLMNDDSLYGYDFRHDYWFSLGPNPGLPSVSTICVPISTHGVVAFIYGRREPTDMKLYKYSGPNETKAITSIDLIATSTTIEQKLSTQLKVIATYSGGAIDTTVAGNAYYSLDPAIAEVTPNGRVIGHAIGTAEIIAYKREAGPDTITIEVVANTSPFDSVVLSINELSFLATDTYQMHATGYYAVDGEVISIVLDTLAAWSSADEGVVTVDNGLLTGQTAGGPIEVSVIHNGVTDKANITIWPKPAFIKRINFQVDPDPFSYGWLADNGQAFDASRGYGWSARQSTTRDDRGGDNFLLKSLVNAGSTGAQWTLAVPAGEYIVKIGMGDNIYGSTTEYTYTIHGTDTLVRHIGKTNTIAIDTVTVSGSALTLTVTGAINYIVVISDEGIDIDQVADDGGTSIPGMIEEGVQINEGNMCIQVYPNPFNTKTIINLNFKLQNAKCKMQIYDIHGRMVQSFGNVTGNKLIWHANGLPSGTYILRLKQGKQAITKRIMLMR